MSNQNGVAAGSALVDRFGRVHRSLRVSVTDRCNLRCTYCMPEHTPQYQPRSEILTFEEIVRFVQIAVSLGVADVRLTGGEPLVRAQLHRLIESLCRIEGLDKVSVTTNGVLLEDQLDDLLAAGLRHVNVSLDALDEETFRAATRRSGLQRVLSGIDAAVQAGMNVKVNSIAMRGLTEHQIVAFGKFTRRTGIPVRFIEFMPLDSDGNWDTSAVFSGDEIIAMFERLVGPLEPVQQRGSAPAADYRFTDGQGTVGVIASVTKPFCNTCDRFRLTADGQLRNCLFGEDSGDVRELLRSDASDERIIAAMQESVKLKKRGHGTDDLSFLRPSRPMHAIGG
ncbi:GTP 3',8-cyclase MoaA [Allorhodopirellula solitaria]|uniref:GTP 3',8-cyclase n=1 Tax=Allorhodopirellula solitaria TaxID=2527987 RepID=A0A5C5XT14_9BACT|nr:GTP 3',8-cyclase MoaA [Allorhodopirellula solitaria]TWT64852.1 Cyclic pyranopterin monophosphate synthase [Allorhodopirellula solitaria]